MTSSVAPGDRIAFVEILCGGHFPVDALEMRRGKFWRVVLYEGEVLNKVRVSPFIRNWGGEVVEPDLVSLWS